MVKNLVRKIVFGSISLVAIVAISVGDVIYFSHETDVVGQLCPPKVTNNNAEASKAEGDELAKKIEGEGAVLVKNDGALPLASQDQVNLLGYGANQWIYGGSGSGRVLPTTGDSSWNDNISIQKAFENYGVSVNEDILNYYKSYATANHDINTLGFNVDSSPYSFGLKEPNIENNTTYSQLLEDSKTFSDTAVVVISRQGGESEDMPSVQYKVKPTQSVDNTRHSLEISTEEEELLTYAGENYENVIVLINSTNSFQTSFLDEIPGLDACLIVGATGNVGADSIPKLIYGDITPSGRLSDTIPYDFTQNLSYNYSGYDGVSFYKGMTSGQYGVGQTTNAGVTKRPSLPYLDYVENIYVGYRYYETADYEGAFKSVTHDYLNSADQNITKTGYDAVVQYPFGYGLSYTTFNWEVISVSLPNNSELTSDSDIAIEVKVDNTGSKTGKDVVQLYMTPQYNEGGIEKSYMKLVDFAKTDDIEPGKSQTLTLTAKARDFASYDCYDKNGNNSSTYEIDKGNYSLKLCKNSHNISKVDFVTGKTNQDGIINYVANNDIILDKDPTTGNTVGNLFTDENAIDGVSVDGTDGEDADIDYVSRTDLKNNIAPLAQSSTHEASTGREMGSGTKDNILFAGSSSTDSTKANEWNNATEDEFGNSIDTEAEVNFGIDSGEKVTTNGAVNSLGLALGKDYNDPQWDSVLDELSIDDIKTMINNSHPYVQEIKSVGMPKLYSLDGPNQCGSFASVSTRGVGYPCATVRAQTFSKTLNYEFGLSLGTDMDTHGLNGIYGVAINLHRSPFSGRNYEYYSEDPLLTGDLAALSVKGIRQLGKIAYVKHLAVAETETSRDSLYTWLTEQSLRELYLEPFRIVVEEGGANGMMTSYNRIGSVWAGGSAALLKGVLRNEWGFNGAVITDYSDNNQYMNLDETIRKGGDLGMAVSLKLTYNTNSSSRIKQALKDTAHHTMYAYLNSQYSLSEYKKNPYNGQEVTTSTVTPSFNWVTPAVIDINIAIFTMAACFIYFGVFDAIGLNKDVKIKDADKKGKNV
jgi:beta-glucosidase